MIFELCTDSIKGAKLAQQFGAKRIELCSALSVGGLTPSPALTALCTNIQQIETHVMIRPTEGDFVYSAAEIEVMMKDIQLQAEAGAKGVVFGCLTKDKTIDIQQNITLVEGARKYGLECTFHRAFDFVTFPIEALESIINIGFKRILTSGGKPTANEGIELIRQLVENAIGQIEIMAGSGVNSTNAVALASTGIAALHFTSHDLQPYQLGMGASSVPNKSKIQSITALFQ
ncbi:copper homeostasis protein CutC [Vicingaceae bacterium]|nr:copper homeostasis protein CutC [Vicingaceae bacterium]MDB4062206.1 copper homeostasis protein CutC [Vicingaceae bacterium]MDC1451583.1 copper homeostasis protein CutC [Vicingaceae bacterium]